MKGNNLSNNLVNCKKCGAVFRKSFRDICPSCIEKEHKEIEIINKFVADNKDSGVSIEVLSEKLDIPTSAIQYYISKGRLNEAVTKIRQKCRICGVELPDNYTKKFVCPKCKESVEKTIEEVKIEAKANKKFEKTAGFKARNEESKGDKGSNKFGFKKNYD